MKILKLYMKTRSYHRKRAEHFLSVANDLAWRILYDKKPSMPIARDYVRNLSKFKHHLDLSRR